MPSFSTSFAPRSFIAFAAAFLGSTASVQAAAPDTELDALRVEEIRLQSGAGTSRLKLDDYTAPLPDIAELAHNLPNLALGDAGAGGFGQVWSSRGLSNTPFFSDASVGVYLDDLPLRSVSTFPLQLLGWETLLFHRGAQAGSLFGRSGDAGVLELRSPVSSDRARIDLRASGGSFDQRSGSLAWTSARQEGFDAQLQFGHEERDGYIENTQLHRSVDSRDSSFGRARLRFRPTKTTEFSVQGLAHRARDGTQALVPLNGPFFTLQRDREGSTDSDLAVIGATFKAQTAAGLLESHTSFSDWQLDPLDNRLRFFGNFDSLVDQREKVWNQEVRFQSNHVSLGGFVSQADSTGGAVRAFDGFTVENSSFSLRTKTAALFGRALFPLAGKWSASAGLRLEHTRKSFTRDERVPASTTLHRSDRWLGFSPSLAFARTTGERSALTLTVLGGYKPGGYSAFTGRADLAAFGAQRLAGLEAAWTAESADRHWSFTARSFAYRIRGYQIERSFAVPGSFSDEYLVVNAARARSVGGEFEGAWKPAAGLTLSASAGVTRAILSDFTDPFTRASFSGKRVPYAPAGTASLRVVYAPSPEGIFASAGVTATGRTYYDEQETAALSQRAYTLADASLGYALPAFSVSLFGRNLFDREYYRSITPGVLHGTPGAPFTWGIEARARW